MRFLTLMLISVICTYLTASAQSLYVPRNVKASFERGVRSPDGKPGPNYWQNHGRYHITLTAMPPDRMIKGSEEITYFNDSPDTLKHIVMRLILNFHKPEATHGSMDSSLLTSGIHIDRFAINGQSQTWHDPRGHFTWQAVRLPEPLMPGDSVHLSIDWHDMLAAKDGREGTIDSTTFYIAYFYPRVSVYDDYNGWDVLEFTGRQEFYNDFNDYTLQVNVPKNFIVWSTGTLQNPDEVLQPLYAQALKASMVSDSILHIATPKDLAEKNITAQNDVNTWKWKADDVSDMALIISDHYNWDAGSVVVDDGAHRRSSVQAAYNDTAADFHQAVRFGQEALYWFSRNWPGVPYPYPKMTLVQGHADMEYPMMINDGSTRDLMFSQLVANHEIAHTYFPFYMGTNESRYAFMDEGWATTFEYLIGKTQNPPEKADEFYKMFRVNRWINDLSQEAEVPIITPSNIVNGIAYGANAYGKPSLAYLALKDMLGDALFKKCLHGYMERWHGKHPIPWDFFNTFNNISGKNLNWFWNNWFFSHGYDDLAVGKVTKIKGGYTLTVDNVGGFAIPFDVKIAYSDGTTGSMHHTSAIWEDNQKQVTIPIKTTKEIQSVTLDNGLWMDANEKDNVWNKS